MILGLIVFTIGGSFSLKAVRKIGSGLFLISAFEIGLTALLVGAGTYLLSRSLLVAGDIATRVPLKLTPDDSIETAMEALKKHPGNTWLVVVDKNDPKKLLGMVRHNDVLSTHLYQDVESNSR